VLTPIPYVLCYIPSEPYSEESPPEPAAQSLAVARRGSTTPFVAPAKVPLEAVAVATTWSLLLLTVSIAMAIASYSYVGIYAASLKLRLPRRQSASFYSPHGVESILMRAGGSVPSFSHVHTLTHWRVAREHTRECVATPFEVMQFTMCLCINGFHI